MDAKVFFNQFEVIAKVFFNQFEVIIHVLVSPLILINMLWVYCHACLILSVRGSYMDVRLWRQINVPLRTERVILDNTKHLYNISSPGS